MECISLCAWHFLFLLCQPVHSCNKPSLHGLDFFLEIFFYEDLYYICICSCTNRFPTSLSLSLSLSLIEDTPLVLLCIHCRVWCTSFMLQLPPAWSRSSITVVYWVPNDHDRMSNLTQPFKYIFKHCRLLFIHYCHRLLTYQYLHRYTLVHWVAIIIHKHIPVSIPSSLRLCYLTSNKKVKPLVYIIALSILLAPQAISWSWHIARNCWTRS